ncbi:thioredoxin family protein [Lutibacter sp. HS1-25]|uniref:thioredoxin family protein n=1 Tax=Lutibacter sp. HS1-25 TaxID=2485000 RepID=UPI0013E99ADD|nr:thioredoxin family protein [Lutibacter sp. HS1-25]
MINTLKHILFAIVLITTFFANAQTNFETTSWDLVKEKATKENKLIFVDLYFTGCPPCKEMDEDVFPTKEVSTVLNKYFVSFKSDIFKEDIGKKLSMKYGVSGFPTFVFLNAEGQVIDITSGFHEVEEFTALLATMQENAANNIFKKYNTSLDGNYPDFYVDAYMNNKRQISFETFDAYLKNETNLGAEIPFVIISSLRVGGLYADYIVENAAQLAEDYGRNQVKNTLTTIVLKKINSLEKTKNYSDFNSLLSTIKPIYTDVEWAKYEPLFQKQFTSNKL